MASASYPGTCLVCHKNITNRTADKHLRTCIKSAGYLRASKPSYQIKVQNTCRPEYWLILLARADTTLSVLDSLLRDVWVDCCGHLSAFIIDRQEYQSSPEGSEDGMDIPLSKVINNLQIFEYEYDFGSTTYLTLTVTGTCKIFPPGEITILSRNDPPKPPCHICGGDASLYCANCLDEEEWVFCENCAYQHDCGEDDFRAITNSPRWGVCGDVGREWSGRRWYPAETKRSDYFRDSVFIPVRSRRNGNSFHFMPSLDVNNEGEEDVGTDEDIQKLVSLFTIDIGYEFSIFVQSEYEKYGEDQADLSSEIVSEFCVFLYGIRTAPVNVWTPDLLSDVLLNEMARNPIPDPEWTGEVVPAFSRFLSHLQVTGRIQDSDQMISALKTGESDFIIASLNQEKMKGIANRVIVAALQKGIDLNDERMMGGFIIEELLKVTGLDTYQNISKIVVEDGLSGGMIQEPGSIEEKLPFHPSVIHPQYQVRYAELVYQCRRFCDTRSDLNLFKTCQEILLTLAIRDEKSISQGTLPILAAGVVYTACQNQGLIGRGCPDTGLVKEICNFFRTKLSSTRQKSIGIRNRLDEIRMV